MPDHAKVVRDAAKNLADAIQAATEAGYHVGPTGLTNMLGIIAISETAAVEEKRKAAAEVIAQTPTGKAGAAAAADAAKG